MDLPGCETTVKSINHNASPHLEAAKEVREPVDKPGRMTHCGQQQQQQQHLLLRVSPGTSNPRPRGGLVASAY